MDFLYINLGGYGMAKIWKQLISIVLLVLVANVVYSAYFYGEDNPFNITLDVGENKNYTLQISNMVLWANDINISLDLSYNDYGLQKGNIDCSDAYNICYRFNDTNESGGFNSDNTPAELLTASINITSNNTLRVKQTVPGLFEVYSNKSVDLSSNNFCVEYRSYSHVQNDGTLIGLSGLDFIPPSTYLGLVTGQTLYGADTGWTMLSGYKLGVVNNDIGVIYCQNVSTDSSYASIYINGSFITASNYSHHFRTDGFIYFSRSNQVQDYEHAYLISWNGTPADAPYLNRTHKISIDGQNQYNTTFSAFYNKTLNISLNHSKINSLMSEGCSCVGCSISDVLCNIPINFQSDTYSVYSVYLHNMSPYLGVVNCSNSFNISSNSTALNITWLNGLTPINVNATINIDSTYYDYYTTLSNVSSRDICIYPASLNQSAAVTISYQYGDTFFNFYDTLYLDSDLKNIILQVDTNTKETQFTIKDEVTGNFIEGALVTSYARVNGVFVVKESKLSDITGRVKLNYLENQEYKFHVSKVDYSPSIFTLNPVLFDSYNIILAPTSSINYSQDMDRISIAFSPPLYTNNQNNTFTFLIGSPYSELISYGYTLTYPGGTTSNQGTNTQGDYLTSNISIVGAEFNDRGRLDYFYDTELSGIRNFTFYYPISVNSTEGTFMELKGDTFGLGLFERVFIITIALIFIVGIASLIGQAIPGLALSLMFMGFFVYVGFIPIWTILISFFGMIIILGGNRE